MQTTIYGDHNLVAGGNINMPEPTHIYALSECIATEQDADFYQKIINLFDDKLLLIKEFAEINNLPYDFYVQWIKDKQLPFDKLPMITLNNEQWYYAIDGSFIYFSNPNYVLMIQEDPLHRYVYHKESKPEQKIYKIEMLYKIIQNIRVSIRALRDELSMHKADYSHSFQKELYDALEKMDFSYNDLNIKMEKLFESRRRTTEKWDENQNIIFENSFISVIGDKKYVNEWIDNLLRITKVQLDYLKKDGKSEAQ